MIDEPTEETASLYVLDLLAPEDARAFESRCETDADLRQHVAALRETAAALAHRAPPREVPPQLEARIFSQIRGEEKVVPFSFVKPAIPWAIAASLAVACFILNSDRGKLLSQLDDLQQRDVFCKMQIAMLSSKLESAPNASAVVVWDEEKQSGMLKVIGVPPAESDRHYHLWVIDPKYPQPVSAGVFTVEKPDLTPISFHASEPISHAEKFAVSLDPKGSAAEEHGPIVMISD